MRDDEPNQCDSHRRRHVAISTDWQGSKARAYGEHIRWIAGCPPRQATKDTDVRRTNNSSTSGCKEGEIQKFVVALVFVLTPLVGGTAMALNAAEQELIAVENAWAEAAVKADGAALEKLYADEYLFTDENRVVWS